MEGWLFILLCAAVSVLVAHILKIVENRELNTVRVLTINYAVAAGAAVALSGSGAISELYVTGGVPVAGLAVLVGIFFIANFFIYSKSVFRNGVGISIAAMRLSLIIPVLVSVFWYSEPITFWQWTGTGLVFATLFLLMPVRSGTFHQTFPAALLLVLLFLCTGVGDAALKIYEEEFTGLLQKELFMGMVFFCSFLTGTAVVLFGEGPRFTRQEVGLGIVLGIPNLYTAIFLIEALERMNGAIVYAAVNVLTVLGGTVLGYVFWGDKLSKAQWAGIFLTLGAVFLLV